jgi:Cu/Ag efflux protein CusF
VRYGGPEVFTMSIRVKGWIAAVALVAFVGVPLAASAGQADQPPAGQAGAQATSASGELVKVDATAKTLTIKADGRDQQFSFNEQTKITGAQGAAGLATMEGSQVTVMYGKDRTATEIRVSPKK